MATKVNPVTGALDYYEQALPPFRNKIYNGGMQIAQRGDVTGITSTTYGGPDRFQSILGTAGTWSLSKSTDAPSGSGFSNSFKIDCTTANSSLSSGSLYLFGQKLEGQNVQDLAYGTSSAKNVTLSFWVKSSVAQNFYGRLETPDGTSQNYPFETGSLSADTWTKITKTISGDSNITFNNDNGLGLQFDFFAFLGTGSTGTMTLNQWGNYCLLYTSPSPRDRG